MEIRDKVILITGSSSGIGKAVTEIMSAKGGKLALIARREVELNKLAKDLSNNGYEILVAPADITHREMVASAVKETINKFGRIDIVINNAGLGYFGSIENMSMEDFDRVIKTNIYGLINVTQEVIPYLKESKGMIVNVSSGLSKRALPFLSAYAGTKSMVDSLSDGMRLELKKYGIKVLNYCPPETETEFHANSRKEIALEMGQRHRKMAKVEDVANNIVNAIIGEKREVVEGRFLQVMNFYAPKVLDNIFYKGMVLKMTKDR